MNTEFRSPVVFIMCTEFSVSTTRVRLWEEYDESNLTHIKILYQHLLLIPSLQSETIARRPTKPGVTLFHAGYLSMNIRNETCVGSGAFLIHT